jgi:palmitoyl transferase
LKVYLILFALVIQPAKTFAGDVGSPSIWNQLQSTVSETWESSDHELYVPINTWHNRNYYKSEKIEQFNEQPWGLGLGKYRFDEDGDWHAIYGIAFLDSNNDVEPIAGYAFQKTWRPIADVRVGAGYTVGITLRKDLDYVPLPVVAPLFSMAYKKLAVQSTYILGGDGFGNILFTWVRWQM